MKLLYRYLQKLGDAFMHYVCLRLRFRSLVLQGSLPKKEELPCAESCCPSES